MKEELIRRILNMLISGGIDAENLEPKLVIILNDYDISKRVTELSVRNDDKNIELIKKFLIAKTVSGRTDRTIKYYSDQIRKIFSRINKTADEITTDDIRYYMAIRERVDGVSKVTIGNEFRALSSFYTWARKEELVDKNPCEKIERPKQRKQQKKAFTEIEIEKIRNACRTNREKAIVETLLSTGCRVTELVLMKIDDINDDHLIVHGKGEKDRVVYLNAKAIMALQRYMIERSDQNPYIFCGRKKADDTKQVGKINWYMDPGLVSETHIGTSAIEQNLRKIGDRAGVEKVHPHRFRRTCATMALRHGMPIEQVSKMLGHEKIETTQIYLDLSEEELHLAHKKYVV